MNLSSPCDTLFIYFHTLVHSCYSATLMVMNWFETVLIVIEILLAPTRSDHDLDSLKYCDDTMI